MADKANTDDAAAEKAYADAAADKVSAKKVAKAVEADAPKAKAAAKPAAKKAPARKKAPAKKVAAKPAAPKAAPKPAAKAPVKKATAKKPAAKKPAPKPAKPQAAAPKKPTATVTQLKEKIMATAKTTDFTKTATDMAAEMQDKMKAAYEKSGEFAGEMGEFAKGNVEAVVESGKIFFSGVQDMSKSDLEATKSAMSTVTEDVKKMAAAKSPTELMNMQSELMRRNFDALIAFGSSRTENLVKLYNDAFAPISTRVSVAAEKVSKAA